MKASATTDGVVSWPRAAAVTVDAGVLLPKRAAVQLRALHPAQVTPCPLRRPWQPSGHGTGGTACTEVIDLRTEDLPVEGWSSAEVRTTLAGGDDSLAGDGKRRARWGR